jgi:hypothetical protein
MTFMRFGIKWQKFSAVNNESLTRNKAIPFVTSGGTIFIPNIMKISNSLFILVLLVSCNGDNDNVNLEMEYGWNKGLDIYYEIGSDTPYTGKFVRKSIYNTVTIDFKNGKMDGDFVRLNNKLDTTEYRIYKNGGITYQLDVQYTDDEVVHRGTHKLTAGSIEDERIFEQAIASINSNDFDELDKILGYSNRYEAELNSLTNQFGQLVSVEIIEITNTFNSYQKREDLGAQMIFNYKDIQLRTSLRIVRDSSSNIEGHSIGIKPVPTDLIVDTKIDEVINILTTKDIDKCIAIRGLGADYEHKAELVDYLDTIGKISSDYKFLETIVWPGDKMIFIKNYLVEIDGDKKLLALWYKEDSKNTLSFNIFHISPYRHPIQILPY